MAWLGPSRARAIAATIISRMPIFRCMSRIYTADLWQKMALARPCEKASPPSRCGPPTAPGHGRELRPRAAGSAAALPVPC